MSESGPWQAFCDAFEPSVSFEPELVEVLDDVLQRARAEESELELDPVGFARFVAERCSPEDLRTDLTELKAGDLWLVFGCTQGNERALLRFERRFAGDIDAAIARSANADIGKDDFRQHLFAKLFAPGANGRPRIADYSGRGDLRGWLRVAIVRQVIDFVRRKQRRDLGHQVDEAAMLELRAATVDPELAYVRDTYKRELREALREGFASLTPRDRNILRHFLFHGLGIDEVGRMYGVHRTTAFRWRQRAQTSLLEATRDALRARLGTDSKDLRSVVRVLESDLHITVHKLLPEGMEDEG